MPLAVLFLYCLATKRLRRMFLPLAAGCLLSARRRLRLVLPCGKGLYGRVHPPSEHRPVHDRLRPHRAFLVLFPQALRQLPALEPRPAFRRLFRLQAQLWLPLIWLLVTFVFFDISKSKRAIYLLSCYPACALLVGIYLKERWYALAEGRWTRLHFLHLRRPSLLRCRCSSSRPVRRVPLVAQMFAGSTPLFVRPSLPSSSPAASLSSSPFSSRRRQRTSSPSSCTS